MSWRHADPAGILACLIRALPRPVGLSGLATDRRARTFGAAIVVSSDFWHEEVDGQSRARQLFAHRPDRLAGEKGWEAILPHAALSHRRLLFYHRPYRAPRVG